MITQSTIFVRTSFVGFHKWGNAPSEVAYLQNLHRHVFNVEVRVRVTHDDRQVEYHMLKRDVIGVLHRRWSGVTPGLREYVLGETSCEQLAKYLLQDLVALNYAAISVQVDEDGENGSLVEIA